MLLGLACLSLLEFRVITVIHGGHLQSHLDTAIGNLTGHPDWKAFQNRILGPALVVGLSKVSHLPFGVCYKVFCFAMLCVTNSVCYLLCYKQAGRVDTAWAYTVAYAAMFVFFQDNNALYLWDYVDFTTMMVFAWMVMFGEYALWQIAALYLVELLNRESAQFIALWIVLDSVQFTKPAASRIGCTINFPRLCTGVALGVLGYAWTIFIRNKLCVQQTRIGELDRSGAMGGQFFTLFHTFERMNDSSSLTPLVVLALLVGLLFFVWRGWAPLGPRAWKVVALTGAMVTANLCFAIVLEMRVWFVVLPLLLWFVYVVQARAPSDRPALSPGGFRRSKRPVADRASALGGVAVIGSSSSVSNGFR